MTEPKTLPPLPDRLSSDPRSPHHVAGLFEHDIGVRFNGKDRHDVAEFCVSEGWVKVAAERAKDRRGNPLLIKLKGKVQAYYRGLDEGQGPDTAPAEVPAPAALPDASAPVSGQEPTAATAAPPPAQG